MITGILKNGIKKVCVCRSMRMSASAVLWLLMLYCVFCVYCQAQWCHCGLIMAINSFFFIGGYWGELLTSKALHSLYIQPSPFVEISDLSQEGGSIHTKGLAVDTYSPFKTAVSHFQPSDELLLVWENQSAPSQQTLPSFGMTMEHIAMLICPETTTVNDLDLYGDKHFICFIRLSCLPWFAMLVWTWSESNPWSCTTGNVIVCSISADLYL